MQKKIIALAVAGLVSGAAFAQSNVTVYGIADAYYVYSSGKDKDFSGVQSGGMSGGRIGFRGEEALGNGLKAVFTYEFGSLNIDVNDTSFGTRQSFVGLSGGFGTVSAGRQYAPSFMYLGGTSSNEVTVVNPSNLGGDAGVGAFATMNTGGGSRWNNSIAYTSPNMSGFEVRAIYGFGEQVSDGFSDASTNASLVGIGAKYANGPLYLTAIYQGILKNDKVAIDGGNDAWSLGGSFDFKVVKLFANYIQESDDRLGLDVDKNFWSVGLSTPLGAKGLGYVEYVQFKNKDINDGKAKGFGIGYNHSLSKRTTAYINASYIDNDDGLAAAFNGVGVKGESNTNFAVGVRHVF